MGSVVAGTGAGGDSGVGGKPRSDGADEGRNGAGGGRSGADRLFGIVAGVMIALAAYLLVNSLLNPPVAEGAPPRVELLSPSAGDTVALPFEIQLRSERALSVQPGGWGVSGFHIHAEVAGVEFMPAANDIRPTSGGGYAWTIATVPSGPTTVRLFWADAAHRPVGDGASEAVPIVVR